jgi:hypothetical protein
MRKIGHTRGGWSICVGILLAILGVGLMRFNLWHILPTFLLLLGLLFFIRKNHEPTSNFQEKVALEREGIYLGRFDLNGYSFEAYECESDKNGTQLRLTAFPTLTHEQEAAFIRYIVNEGLAENIWPGMGKKIAAEANWAFFE